MKRLALAGFAFALSLLAAIVAAQPNPFTGNWKMNLAKSTFHSGTIPSSEDVTFRVTGDEEYMRAEIVNPDGSRSITEYTARFDGKEYPVTNAAGTQTGLAVLKRTDPWHEERYSIRDGKRVSTLRREVSKDGKTFTSTSMDAAGKVSSVRVFEKQ